MSELAGLATESARADTAELDRFSAQELVAVLAAEDRVATDAVAGAGEAITVAADAVVERFARGGRLVYVGAGTPGRLGLADAAEAPPTFGVDPDRVVALMAGGGQAERVAVEGAEDDTAAGEEAVRGIGVGQRDAVLGITASGRTPYALAALSAARAAGALTVGVTCTVGSKLVEVAELMIETPTGPEVIAGSTRLKEGTAQKIVLSTLSTVVMVRAGRTYGNLMVDMRASNAKLRARATRLVELASGAGSSAAEGALAEASGEVKTAIVMLRTGSGPPQVRAELAAHGGRVRDTLEAAGVASGLPSDGQAPR
jgi:N-acetylmuramic acid 6-phosphate etherase